MANEYQIISDIIGNTYQQDLAENPWVVGAQSMGQLGQADPQDKWYEALAKGLLYGGVKGGMLGYGMEDTKQQKAINSEDANTYARLALKARDDPSKSAELKAMEIKSPFMKEIAAKVNLANLTNEMTDQYRMMDKNLSPEEAKVFARNAKQIQPELDLAQLEEEFSNMNRNSATVILQRMQKADNSSLEKTEGRSRASKWGSLSGEEEYYVGKGALTPNDALNVRAIQGELETHPLAKQVQQMNQYVASVEELAKQNNVIASQGLAALMPKVFDALASAREGEQQAIRDSRPWLSKLQGLVAQGLGTDQLFSEEDRAHMLDAAKAIQGALKQSYAPFVKGKILEAHAISPYALSGISAPIDEAEMLQSLAMDMRRARDEGDTTSERILRKRLDSSIMKWQRGEDALGKDDPLVIVEDEQSGRRISVPKSIADQGEQAVLDYIGGR